VELCLFLDTVLKLLSHMCTQFPVNNQLPHLVPVLLAGDKL
jgi:hypothetical protein